VPQIPSTPATKPSKVSTTRINDFILNDPKCDRCEASHKECVRNDRGARCVQCTKLKQGCTLAKGRSKINFIPNDPKCERCERSRKECVRKETQDHGTKCKHCAKDEKDCKYLSKGQSSKIKSKPPPKASKSMEESSSSSRNFDLERLQQQLKVSQEDLRIAQHCQQQLQLANSRIEAQRDLYEAQLAGYRARGQGSGKAKERA